MPPRAAPSRGQPPSLRGTRGGSGRGRGGGASRGGSSRPQAQSSGRAVAEHIQTVGVKRPDYGRAGRPIGLIVNAFPVSHSEGTIFHYDVAIDPDTLPSKFNMKLIQHMQKLHQDVFTPQAVYDGRKNMFAARRLPLGSTNSREFDIPSPDGGGGGGKRPPKMYKIKVTIAAEINTVVLQRFVEQSQSMDESVLTAIMALNVVIRMEPNQKYPFNVRSFFTPQGKRAVGGGLELWRGFFQSLRPSVGRLIVNVDTSTGMMYRAGTLIDLCLDFLGQQDPLVLSPAKGFPDRERIRLSKFIKNVKVKIETKTSGPQRYRSIQGMSRTGADQTMFDHNGTQMSVAQYFKQQLNQPLRFPSLPCVEVGKGAMYPLEFCSVPEGQIARRQVPPDVTRKMVEFSTLRPADRFRDIERGVGLLAYGQSEYVRQFGLTVDTANGPLRLQARVLNTPKLQYGQGSKDRFTVPRNGSWNMADKKFVTPIPIKQWIVIIYETRRRFAEDRAEKMVHDFVSACATVGMNVYDKNPIIRWEQGQGDIGAQIRAAGSECVRVKKSPPNLVVVILPDNGDDIYKSVKHFGDHTMGVATQCLKSSKVFKANIQYWANVLLKVNVKLGGVNLIPDPASVAVLTDPNNPTIVLGADVIHPAPGLIGVPSYAALVGNVDANVSKYIAVTRLQNSRVEIIETLEDMCKHILRQYVAYRKEVEKTTAPLKRLIFYRDGVSEGQFQQVLDQELPQIQSACREFGFQPKITLIVVGKRHHMRFKTQSDGDADRSGNAPAGTVVDKDLGHPTEFDFYLQSHGGLLGTSRSSHYSVLYDDNAFNADTLQALSFALCHVYARSTRSVSIPAPVYYADIVCARAKFHYDPNANFSMSETMSQVSEATGSTSLERYKAGFKPLHPNQAGHMYFM